MEEVGRTRILVVGGAGFIGHKIVARAISMGWNVTSLGKSMPKPHRKEPGVNYIVADLIKKDSLKILNGKKYDYIINASGYVDHSPFFERGLAVIENQFIGLLNLTLAIDKSSLKRFIQIGSSDEYGNAKSPQSEIYRESPASPYAFAKVAATHFLQMLYRNEGFPAVVLRIFLTYGPGQGMDRLVPQIICGCLVDAEFEASKGDQIRDLCYVDDLVDAIFLATKSELIDGEVINIGSGQPIQIREFIEKIIYLVGRGKSVFGKLPYRKNENMSLYSNSFQAQELLRWKLKTPLEQGLMQTIFYYENELKSKNNSSQ